MKRALLTLAFALVSPVVFAQSNSNGETENPVTPGIEVANSNGETENPVMPKTEGAISTTEGAVSAFAPDEMIALTTAQGESVSLVLSPTATYLDMRGNEVEASSITEGATVQVTVEENGDQRTAIRIVVNG